MTADLLCSGGGFSLSELFSWGGHDYGACSIYIYIYINIYIYTSYIYKQIIYIYIRYIYIYHAYYLLPIACCLLAVAPLFLQSPAWAAVPQQSKLNIIHIFSIRYINLYINIQSREHQPMHIYILIYMYILIYIYVDCY